MFYDAKNGKIDIENTQIDYISFGKGNKTLIMIPGLGEGLTSFKGLATPLSIMYKMFAKEYKVYIFSRRKAIPEGFSTKDMADDLAVAMESLGIENAHIIGVSQGGMIAQHLAINYPEKINKLVLVVTVARKNKIMENCINKWIELAINKEFEAIMIDTAEKSYVGKYLEKSKKVSEAMGPLGKNATYDRFIAQAKACETHNTYDELHKIEAQTLIIGAGQDKVLGIEGSLELAEKIKLSELYIYDEYSHGAYEQAKDFNKRVFEYLKK